MLTDRLSLYRIIITVALVIALFGLAVPQPVQAAGSATFTVIKVVPDQTVTIRTYNFPAGQLFTVRMDVAGNAAANGLIVTQTNSGAGGSFEETYRIPAELRGRSQITIRLESSGLTVYNWFNNVTSSSNNGVSTNGNSGIPVTGKGINIKIAGVDANNSVTIDANNFPPHTLFKVRVGPFNNFWKGHAVLDNLDSGNGGNFRFTLKLPGAVKDAEWVSVRMDAYTGGWYVYNAFKNVDSKTITPGPGTVNPPVVSGTCDLVSYAPEASIKKGADFDAKWTIENTSDSNWNMTQVDYKFLGGTDMNKYESRYDLPKTVKPGGTITLIVDMKAPNSAGWYTTYWGLVVGKTTICRLPLTIQVK